MSRLLVADQDARALLVMEMSLRNAGIEVTGVESAEEALAHLEAEEYDLILSEVDLPGLTGFDFLEKVKNDARLSSMPFIFVTRRQNVEDKIQGLEMGADDYITRPIYLREFVTRVRSFLRKRELEAVGTADLRQKYRGKITSNVVHDIILSTEEGKRSARLVLERQGRNGTIYIQEGRVIDAECGRITGTQALYRLLLWNDGMFMIHFAECDRKPRIKLQNEELFFQAMSRSKVWRQLQKLVKGLSHISLLDVLERSDRLRDPPEALRSVVRTMMTGNLPAPAKVAEDLPEEFVSHLKFLARHWEVSDERFLVRVEQALQDEESPPDGTISGTWSMDENTELARYWRDILLRDREDEGQSLADQVVKPSNRPLSGAVAGTPAEDRRNAPMRTPSPSSTNTDQFPVLHETPSYPLRAVSPHPVAPLPSPNYRIPRDEDIGRDFVLPDETTKSREQPLLLDSREDTTQGLMEPEPREVTPPPMLASPPPPPVSTGGRAVTFPALWVDRDIEEPEPLPIEEEQQLSRSGASSQSIPVVPRSPLGQKARGDTTSSKIVLPPSPPAVSEVDAKPVVSDPTPEPAPSPTPNPAKKTTPLSVNESSDTVKPAKPTVVEPPLPATSSASALSEGGQKAPKAKTMNLAVQSAARVAKPESTKPETLDEMEAQFGALAPGQDPYDFSDLDDHAHSGPLPWKMIGIAAMMLAACVAVVVWYLSTRPKEAPPPIAAAPVQQPETGPGKDPLGLAEAAPALDLDPATAEGLQALANPEEDRTAENPLAEALPDAEETVHAEDTQALTADGEEQEPSEPSVAEEPVPPVVALAQGEPEASDPEEARRRGRERAQEARQRSRESRSSQRNETRAASAASPEPSSETGSASEVADYNGLIRKGTKLLGQAKFAEAAQVFEQAVALSPGRAAGHSNLGKAHYNQGQFQKALTAYERAVQLSPRDAASWLSLGELYQLTGQTAKAKAAYQKYLQLAPNGRSANDVRALLEGM